MSLAILQARMSSSRLPGKVLKPLAGQPLVLRQVERLARARNIEQLVVATSVEPSDDPLAEALQGAGIAVHRGPLDDVLARFIGALDAHPARDVVRLTADCPLIDPQVVDATIALHRDSGADYTSNTPETFSYPKGLDVEVVTAEALRAVAREETAREAREHVTWAIWNRPDRWRIAWLKSPNADDGDIRWTVDTPDDYAFATAVYDALYANNPTFTSADVKALAAGRPDLADFGGHRRI
jgi:spore coat polysaccharide biosynthesis protein SpsF